MLHAFSKEFGGEKLACRSEVPHFQLPCSCANAFDVFQTAHGVQSLKRMKVCHSQQLSFSKSFAMCHGDTNCGDTVAACSDARARSSLKTLYGRSLPYRRVFHTEDSSVWERLLYGSAFRVEDACVQKTLPNGRLFRTQDAPIWKTLPYGRRSHTKDWAVQQSLVYHTEAFK